MQSVFRMDEKRLLSLVVLLAAMTSVVMYLNLSDNSNVTYHVIDLEEEDQPELDQPMTYVAYDMPPSPAVVQRDMRHYLCILQTNVVYIYAPAADSGILHCILTRFGYLKDLFVTIPVNKRDPTKSRGYEDVRSTQYLRPSGVTSPLRVYREETIHVFAQPAQYDREAMAKMFPENARYITMLRRPIHRFAADFVYSRLDKHFNTTAEADSPKNYLDNPEYWESQKTTSYCTRNCMSAVLGFPLDETKDIRDTQAAMDVIKQLDKDFSLVLFYEYLDQSLVLLKRHMCWGVTDIMYYLGSTHLRMPSEETLARLSTKEHIRNFRRVNSIDYLVYDYFNQTFWKRIKAEGEDFHKEVQNFQNIQKEVAKYCRVAVGDWNSANKTVIARSSWNEQFDFTRKMCYAFGREKQEWGDLLNERYFTAKRRPYKLSLPKLKV
ncbi:galactose-3-O-sulfotransferase 2-like [Branchiostoma floridae]|uniref:Galactose-3-O-sulfotransferase 2-like n=1 Tax=Branchiostoma floridae TaxID=7739 RepID=A0A9J7L8G9_BRAFL|nr:galactose-3-O-sulfotransferase 2-like [Branchiostoma floridae]